MRSAAHIVGATALLAIALVAMAAGQGEVSAEAGVYTRVMEALAPLDNRLPGSANFMKALTAVEAELREAGLSPQRQLFTSFIPETKICRLTLEGRTLSPVYPLNNGLAAPHTDGVLQGPLVLGGDGSLAALDGKTVEGAIVVIDMDQPHATLSMVFPLGAKAVILVGGEASSAWRTLHLVDRGVVALPLLFMPRAAAERSGLLAAAGKTIGMELAVELKSVETVNLWVELPATEETIFKLSQPEALIASATLDTYGLVPDYCPDRRRAANVALLTETLCRLAKQPRKRSLVAFFPGAHQFLQEGSRHFYYAVGGGRGAGSGDDLLTQRAKMHERELAHILALIDGCPREDLVVSQDAVARALIVRMREWLTGRVNNINAQSRELRINMRHLERFLKHSKTLPPETIDTLARFAVGQNRPLAEETIATLNTQLKDLTAEKARWNTLRQQITKRELSQDPEDVAIYQQVLSEIADILKTRHAEILKEQQQTASHIALYERLKDKFIVGHFDFDFANSQAPWVPGVFGVTSPILGKRFSLGSFLPHFVALGAVYEDIRQPAWEAQLFTDILRPYYKPSSLCVPGVRMLPSIAALTLGIPGFTLMTVGDPLDQDGMPIIRPTELAGLLPQTTALLAAIAQRPEFSLRHPFKPEPTEDRLLYTLSEGDTYRGVQVVNLCQASSDVEGPARDAIFFVAGDRGIITPQGPNYALGQINSDGRIFLPMLSRELVGKFWWTVGAVGYDRQGRLNRLAHSWGVPARLPLFYCYGGGAYDYGFGPDLLGATSYKAQTLNGRSDSPPRTAFEWPVENLQNIFTDRRIRIKRIGSKGELLLVSTPHDPDGSGTPIGAENLRRLNGTRQSASDYWILNESRLKALRSRNIVYDSLEKVHAVAREHLTDAQTEESGLRHALARAHQIAAICLSNRVYAPLRAVTEDLVRAVMVLLLLNIPFAFAMERLIFGFTSIYRQVAGFVGFFLMTFLILYFTHPAFSLAAAPLVIFLAFVIILLGVITLQIVLGKIKKEIRMIQGLASTVHGLGSDSNTALAAVLIGISGMRNRPLKTALTAVTIILLTFTILVFGAFTAEYDVVNTYLGKGRGESRIELRTFTFLGIPQAMSDSLTALYDSSCHVFRRGGMFINPVRPADQGIPPLSPERILYNPANGKTVMATALMGLDPAEAAVNPGIRAVVDWDAARPLPHPAIYLSKSMATTLEAARGTALKLMGRDFTVAGIVDEEALRKETTIDENRITPPDFAATIRNMGKEQGAGAAENDLADIDVGMFEWTASSQIAIADLNVLRDLYGSDSVYDTLLTFYPRQEDVNLEETAAELATLFQGVVHVKSGQGAQRLFFTKAIAGSGFKDVVVPLLLGGLIIFSSLMGSIVDREREIFTYSALGLSPPSVGAIFFAESAVYSVVGGMGGYLLSQLVAKALTIMGTLGWFRPPAMNFSSLSSVMTILIVMAVVILSTIYPALKAGRSANPGVARKWKMPLPTGDDLTFVFPFTVSEPDFKGILSFMHEHFSNHADATLGSFAAREVALFRQDTGGGKQSLGIRADISLAPFDLGIFQQFRMYSKEFEIEGIEEVVIEMKRIGGTRGSWIRASREFAAELRQQFLLWRALPIETVEHYRRQTEAELAGKEIR